MLRETFLRLFRREPLLGLVIAGGLPFFLLAPYLHWGKETIRVDARTAAGVIDRRSNALGRALSEAEREQALADYVEEEILVREAYRNGWHLQDGRVRQRLVVAMRNALNEDLPEPSPEQLRAYYEANRDRYRVPATVSFSQVFFASGPPPRELLGELESGADYREMGDPLWLGTTVVRQTRHQLEGALGESFAATVFGLEAGSWLGPIESSRGFHFVRVVDRRPSELQQLGSIERFVRADWITERRVEVHERKMRRIRERYTNIEP